MPAGLHDGALIVDTGMNNKDFIADAKEFKRAVESLKRTVDNVGQNMASSTGDFIKTIANAKRETTDLEKALNKIETAGKAAMDEISETKKAVSEYKRLNDVMEDLQQQMELVRESVDEDSNVYKDLQEQIEETAKKIEELNEAQKNFGGSSIGEWAEGDGLKKLDELYDGLAEKINRVEAARKSLSLAEGQRKLLEEAGVSDPATWEELADGVASVAAEVERLSSVEAGSKEAEFSTAVRNQIEEIETAYQSRIAKIEEEARLKREMAALNAAAQSAEKSHADESERDAERTKTAIEKILTITDAIEGKFISMEDGASAFGEAVRRTFSTAGEWIFSKSGWFKRGGEEAEDSAKKVDVFTEKVKAATNSLGKIAGTAALSFLKKLAAGAKNAAVQLAKIAGRAVTSGMKKLAAYALGAARGLFGLGRGARDSGRGFQFSLKNLLRYGLGIRSLFVLFNRLRSAIKEGFGALKEYDPRVRASLASLSASLNGLKGASAAAFAPILNAIAPALTTLINLVTQATNALGMFFAALTGQNYYSVAKGVASIGSSAKSSSGSVKELKRQLAGFDELNILSAGSSGSGSGGGGASSGIGFEQTPIAEGIRRFVADMKALIADEDWDGLGRMLGDKINGVFDRVRAAVSWDTLGERITKVLNGITGTINGFVDEVDWSNIGATFAEGLNTIINTVLLWYRGINWSKLGRSLAEALNGLIRRVDWPKIGDLISEKLKALFDFTKNFVITFDEIEAAKAIRTALGRIDWPTLARDFWETAKTAFKKAGNFLKVLMGGDVYDVAGDAVDQMWERGSGSASSQTYATSWVRVFIEKLGATLRAIPWGDIFKTVKDKAGAAISELVSALFGSENGLFIVKFGLGIAAAKIAITGLLGGLSSSIVGGITALGIAAALAAAIAVKKIIDAYKEIEQARKDSVDTAVKSFEDSYKNNAEATIKGYEAAGYKNLTGKTYEEARARVKMLQGYFSRGYSESEANKKVDAYFKGAHAYDEDPLMLARAEAYTKSLQFVADSFEKAGGDVEGWTKAFNANTQATEDNTKAKNKQTKAEARGKAPATVQSTNRPAQTVGAYLRDVFTAEHAHQFKGDASALNIPLNFIPAGAAAYINRPLEYLKKLFAPGTDTSARVNLVRNLWTTVSDWVGGYVRGNVLQGVNLSNAWGNATVNDWVGYRFIKGLVSQGVTLANKWGYNTVNDWAGYGYIKGLVSQGVTLANKWGYNTVNDWAGFGYINGLVSQGVTLANAWGYRTVNDWVGSRITNAVVQNVQLVITQVSSVANAVLRVVGRAMGGIITAGGRALNFASGGMIRGAAANYWKSIPKYASGTGSAHGTMFVAGEAGPEIVGHVNGRTEILNQSQLAQTMEAATYGGMIRALSGVTFTVPAMATGGVLPYEVSAQIAKSAQDIQRTLDENNEDLIQTIISVAGQIVAAVHGIKSAPQGAGGVTAQQVIDEINRRTQMFSASPLRGV